MENVKKHIKSAFTILSTVAVKGDAVDVVAAVRQELRHALAAVDKAEKETEEVTGDGNG